MIDVDELATRVRVGELLDELDITGAVASQMLDEPGRALELLAKVRRARGVRNRAALAISRWRHDARPRPAVPTSSRLEEAEAEPPTLEALELAWSLEPSPVGAALLGLMAVALERHGGVSALHDQVRRRPAGP